VALGRAVVDRRGGDGGARADAPPLRLSATPAVITAGQASKVCVRTQPGEVVAVSAATLPDRNYRVVRTGSSPSGLPCWNVHPRSDTRLVASVVGGPASRTSASTLIDVVPRPRAVSPVQGGRAVAVYLAVAGRPDAAVLRRAEASAAALGYVAPAGADLDCDQGAREGLGLTQGPYFTTAVYFATRAAATDFARLHQPREAGIVSVRTYCLD
jgi:hypothetical protein